MGKIHVCVSPCVCGPESIFLAAQQIQMYIRRFAFFRLSTDRLKQQTHTRTHTHTHTLAHSKTMGNQQTNKLSASSSELASSNETR